MKSVDLYGLHIEANTGAPLVLLREHDAPHRVLPIFVGGPEAASIAMAVSGQESSRPLTHDLMAALVETLDGHLDAAEVTELDDGAFLANLAVSGPMGEKRVDTRPSDAIALAVRLGAPLFVSEQVLDEAGTILPDDDGDVVGIDSASIDDAVAEFRSFLDDLEPRDFDTTVVVDTTTVGEPNDSGAEIDPTGDSTAETGIDIGTDETDTSCTETDTDSDDDPGG